MHFSWGPLDSSPTLICHLLASCEASKNTRWHQWKGFATAPQGHTWAPWLPPLHITSYISIWKKKKENRCLGWKKARAPYKPLTWDAEVSWRAHLSPAWIQPGEPLEIWVTAGTQHTWDPKSSSVPQHHLGTPCFKDIPWFCYHPSVLKEMTTWYIFSAEQLKTGSRKKPVCAQDTGE